MNAKESEKPVYVLCDPSQELMQDSCPNIRCFNVIHLYVDQGDKVNSSIFFVTLII